MMKKLLCVLAALALALLPRALGETYSLGSRLELDVPAGWTVTEISGGCLMLSETATGKYCIATALDMGNTSGTRDAGALAEMLRMEALSESTYYAVGVVQQTDSFRWFNCWYVDTGMEMTFVVEESTCAAFGLTGATGMAQKVLGMVSGALAGTFILEGVLRVTVPAGWITTKNEDGTLLLEQIGSDTVCLVCGVKEYYTPVDADDELDDKRRNALASSEFTGVSKAQQTNGFTWFSCKMTSTGEGCCMAESMDGGAEVMLYGTYDENVFRTVFNMLCVDHDVDTAHTTAPKKPENYWG